MELTKSGPIKKWALKNVTRTPGYIWLGTILNIDEDRDIYQAIHEIYNTRSTARTLIEHAPTPLSFPGLAALAQSRRWNRHCKLFKLLD